MEEKEEIEERDVEKLVMRDGISQVVFYGQNDEQKEGCGNLQGK